jgi:hypothetical protein
MDRLSRRSGQPSYRSGNGVSPPTPLEIQDSADPFSDSGVQETLATPSAMETPVAASSAARLIRGSNGEPILIFGAGYDDGEEASDAGPTLVESYEFTFNKIEDRLSDMLRKVESLRAGDYPDLAVQEASTSEAKESRSPLRSDRHDTSSKHSHENPDVIDTVFWPDIKTAIRQSSGKVDVELSCAICWVSLNYHSEVASDRSSCPCLTDGGGEHAVILPCGHVIGNKCLNKMTATSEHGVQRCPLCRFDMSYRCGHRITRQYCAPDLTSVAEASLIGARGPLIDSILSVPATIPEGAELPGRCFGCAFQDFHDEEWPKHRKILSPMWRGKTEAQKRELSRHAALKLMDGFVLREHDDTGFYWVNSERRALRTLLPMDWRISDSENGDLEGKRFLVEDDIYDHDAQSLLGFK